VIAMLRDKNSPWPIVLLIAGLIAFFSWSIFGTDRDEDNYDQARDECAVSYQRAQDHDLTNLSREAYIERCIRERP